MSKRTEDPIQVVREHISKLEEERDKLQTWLRNAQGTRDHFKDEWNKLRRCIAAKDEAIRKLRREVLVKQGEVIAENPLADKLLKIAAMTTEEEDDGREENEGSSLESDGDVGHDVSDVRKNDRAVDSGDAEVTHKCQNNIDASTGECAVCSADDAPVSPPDWRSESFHPEAEEASEAAAQRDMDRVTMDDMDLACKECGGAIGFCDCEEEDTPSDAPPEDAPMTMDAMEIEDALKEQADAIEKMQQQIASLNDRLADSNGRIDEEIGKRQELDDEVWSGTIDRVVRLEKQIQRLFDAIGLSMTEPDYSAIDELAGAVNEMQQQINRIEQDQTLLVNSRISKIEQQITALATERDALKTDTANLRQANILTTDVANEEMAKVDALEEENERLKAKRLKSEEEGLLDDYMKEKCSLKSLAEEGE